MNEMFAAMGRATSVGLSHFWRKTALVFASFFGDGQQDYSELSPREQTLFWNKWELVCQLK
jgi:hypothetical protein